MSLLDGEDTFVENQESLVREELSYWDEFRRNSDSIYWAFTQHRKEGQHYNGETNELEDWRRENVRDYIETYPDVYEVDNIIVDITALQVQYHCMWKSCKSTGKYCCKKPLCTAHTEQSAEIMKNAGKNYIDNYENEGTAARIRRGDTHTPKLNANASHDGSCVFGEVRAETNPNDGDEYQFIHCGLHEGAYSDDIPVHYAHSIGSSLFPADILVVDDQWFVTAGHPRAKEAKITRWWTSADDTICMAHGDKKDLPILRHPDFDAMYADILGRGTLDTIQEEAYGDSGPIEPNIQDGWMHADERGLTRVERTCDNCSGDGCTKCDQRGYFNEWE